MGWGGPWPRAVSKKLLSQGPCLHQSQGLWAWDRRTKLIGETQPLLLPPALHPQSVLLSKSPLSSPKLGSEFLRGNHSHTLWGSVSRGLPLLVKCEEMVPTAEGRASEAEVSGNPTSPHLPLLTFSAPRDPAVLGWYRYLKDISFFLSQQRSKGQHCLLSGSMNLQPQMGHQASPPQKAKGQSP